MVKQIKVWTIGHSTRGAEEFSQILLAQRIEALIDVRTYPGSRRYPHFNKETLSQALQGHGIDYHHEPRLGGRRMPRPDSRNTAWRNASFRGYADHMETREFEAGIEKLLEVAGERRAAVMCAEADWRRCHRSLIADYLKAAGHEVVHIVEANKTESHPLLTGFTHPWLTGFQD